MKKQNFKKMLNLRSFALIAIFSVAVLATSCNKEDDGYIPSESEMMLKKGKPMDKPGSPAKGESTITEIVVGDDRFNTLESLVIKYELAGFFGGTDQYTVFAPTDGAFDRLFAFAAENEIELTDDLVLNVLLYHVTDGRRASNSVLAKGQNQKVIETLYGEAFLVDASGNIATGSGLPSSIDASVRGETFDISASNGIIHVVNEVLVPEL